MSTIVIFGAFFAFVIAREVYKHSFGFYDYFISTLIAALGGVVGVCVGAIIAVAIGFFVPKQWVLVDTVQLAGLRNGQSNYYVRASLSGTSETYFYYKKDGPALVPGQVRAGSNVSIIEEKDRTSGSLKVYAERLDNKLWGIVAIYVSDKRYEFYVPEGTVIREFNLR